MTSVDLFTLVFPSNTNDTIDEAKEKLFKLYGDAQIMLIQSEVIHDEDIYC